MRLLLAGQDFWVRICAIDAGTRLGSSVPRQPGHRKRERTSRIWRPTRSFGSPGRTCPRFIDVPGPVDAVMHFASPASPPDYLKIPIETMKVGALGTHNSLGLALAKKARFLLASTSECYGDPEVSPQPETYWGT